MLTKDLLSTIQEELVWPFHAAGVLCRREVVGVPYRGENETVAPLGRNSTRKSHRGYEAETESHHLNCTYLLIVRRTASY